MIEDSAPARINEREGVGSGVSVHTDDELVLR
jgi:hypothetical protein